MAKRPKTNNTPKRPPLYDHLQRRCIFARRDLTIYAARLDLREKKALSGQFRLVIDVPGAAEHPEFAEMLSALNPAFEVLDVVGSPDHHPRYQLTADDEWLITSALGEFDDLVQLKALIGVDNKRAAELEKYTNGLTPHGRQKGGESTKQRKAAHKRSVENFVKEKLTGEDAFIQTDEKILSDLVMGGHLKHGEHIIKQGTLKNYIAEIRNEFEKAIRAKNA